MIAIIGIGNPLRRDDNIGNIVSEKLGGIAAYNVPENMIVKVREMKPEMIVFIDAVEFDGTVGEVGLFDMSEIGDEMASTHTVPVKMYNRFFPNVELKVIGIKVKDRGYGEGLSEELDVEKIVTSAKNHLDSLRK